MQTVDTGDGVTGMGATMHGAEKTLKHAATHPDSMMTGDGRQGAMTGSGTEETYIRPKAD